MATQGKLITLGTLVQLLLVNLVIPSMPINVSAAWRWRDTWAYASLSLLGFAILFFSAFPFAAKQFRANHKCE